MLPRALLVQSLALLVVLGTGVQAGRYCLLELPVSNSSTIQLSGSIPSVGSSINQDSGTVVLLGAVFLVLPYDSCPTTPDQLASQLPYAYFVTPTDRNTAITSDPTKVSGSVKLLTVTTASLSLENLKFTLVSSSPLVDNGDGSFAAALNVSGQDGQFYAKALGFVPIKSQSLSGDLIPLTSLATVAATGSNISVNVPFSFQKDLKSGATATLSGTIQASGDALLTGQLIDPSTLPISVPTPSSNGGGPSVPANLTSACVIPATVDSSSSSLYFAGSVTSPVSANVNQSPTVALKGKVYLVIPEGSCPTSIDALLQLLPKSLVLMPNSSDAVAISTDPPSLQSSVTALGQTAATLTLKDFSVALSSVGTLTPDPSSPSTFSLRARATVVAGTVEVASSLVQNVAPQNLTGNKLVAQKTGNISTTATGFTLSYPELLFVYSASGDAGGTPFATTINLVASLTASADLNAGTSLPLTQIPFNLAGPASPPPPPAPPAASPPPVSSPPPPAASAPPARPPPALPANLTSACVMPAQLDSSTSSLVVSGVVTSPVQATIVPSDPAQLSGQLYLVLLQAVCPSSQAELAEALPGALFLYLRSGGQPIRTDPSSITTDVQLGTATIANITLGNFTASLSSLAPVAAAAASGGGYPVQLQLEVLGGTVGVASGLANVAPTSIAGLQLPAEQAGLVTPTATGFTLSYPRLAVVYAASGTSGGTSGSFQANITANVSASGTFSAARMVPLSALPIGGNATASPPPPQASARPPPVSAASPPRAPAMPPPPPSQTQIVSSNNVVFFNVPVNTSAGTCPARATVNASSNACACADGWSGDDCITCGANSVCAAALGDATANCSAGLRYNSKSQYKGYACQLQGGLGAFITGATVLCITSPASNVSAALGPGPLGTNDAAGATARAAGGGYCRLVAPFKDSPTNPLMCTARQCSFTPGSADFNCAASACSCPQGCPDAIQAVIGGVAGAAKFKCSDPDKGVCDVEFEGLSLPLQLTCSAGECVGTAQFNLNSTVNSTDPSSSGFDQQTEVALVAAAPSMLLALLAMVLGTAVVANRGRVMAAKGAASAASRQQLQQGAGPVSEGAEATAQAIALSINNTSDPPVLEHFTLEFVNVTCSVPVGKKRGHRRGHSPAAAGGAAVVDGGPDADLAAAAEAELERRALTGDGYRTLLHGVSGRAAAGEVVAVMGPSGSGKTTLLSILSSSYADVSSSSRIGGAISLAGVTRRSALRRATAYVAQKDVLLPSLTVAECLTYSAALRLPQEVRPEEVQRRVAAVLAELGLANVAGSVVGGTAALRGVSGGERRRVSIGMELVTAPKLVILDEPTSGLDSFASEKLLSSCRSVARHGRVVLMSLHQPSQTLLDCIDRVMFLSRGHLVYGGGVGDLLPYLQQLGLAPLAERRAAAEHMLQLLSAPRTLLKLVDAAEASAERGAAPGMAVTATGPLVNDADANGPTLRSRRNVSAVAANENANGVINGSNGEYQPLPAASGLYPPMGAVNADVTTVRDSATDLESAKAVAGSGPSLHGSDTAVNTAAGVGDEPRRGFCGKMRRAGLQLGVLTWRGLMDVGRTPALLLLQLGVMTVMGLLTGCVFLDLGFDTSGAQNRAGVFFFSLCLAGFSALSVIDSLVTERELLARETRSQYYPFLSHLLPRLVLDGVLLRILPSAIFTAIVYPMVGLAATAPQIATFLFVLATFSCIVGALAVAVAALVRTAGRTTLVMNLVLLIWVLVGGFLVNPKSIPVWVGWIRYVSPLPYAFEALYTNELRGQAYELGAPGVGTVSGVKAESFLLALGLDPTRTLLDVAALAMFYALALALAVVCTGLSLKTWRRGLRQPRSSRKARLAAQAEVGMKA